MDEETKEKLTNIENKCNSQLKLIEDTINKELKKEFKLLSKFVKDIDKETSESLLNYTKHLGKLESSIIDLEKRMLKLESKHAKLKRKLRER